MKSILSKAGYEVTVQDINIGGKSCPLQIQDENAVYNPGQIATLLVNSGHPPTLLKVQKENLEKYFLRVIEEIGGREVG